jgi:hypothetical protein
MSNNDLRKALNNLAKEFPRDAALEVEGEFPWPRALYRYKPSAGRFVYVVDDAEGTVAAQCRTLDSFYEGVGPQTIRQAWRDLRTPTAGVVVWVFDQPHSHHEKVMEGMLEALELSTKTLLIITPRENPCCMDTSHISVRCEEGKCATIVSTS